MRHLAFYAALALFLGWALTSSGCKKAPQGSGPAVGPARNPSAAVPAEPLPGARGELQNIEACWRELAPEMAKEQLAFKVIAAKAWSVAGSVDQIMKLAERATGGPAVPAKGASADDISKVAFAVGMGDEKFPEVFRDVELIGINAKNLAAAAGGVNTAETRKWWAQLDKLCQSVCGGMASPAPAAPPPAGKQ